MEDIMKPDRNYISYRKLLSQMPNSSPCIPFFGNIYNSILTYYQSCSIDFFKKLIVELASFNYMFLHQIGVFIKDLTFLNDGNPKVLANGLYNFTKIRDISNKVIIIKF